MTSKDPIQEIEDRLSVDYYDQNRGDSSQKEVMKLDIQNLLALVKVYEEQLEDEGFNNFLDSVKNKIFSPKKEAKE